MAFIPPHPLKPCYDKFLLHSALGFLPVPFLWSCTELTKQYEVKKPEFFYG